MQQKTLLIVDDDDELREALAEQLELHEEFKVIQASNGTEGLKLGKSVNADLILLDVDLPDMDGREACRLLRKGGLTTPVIMLTAKGDDIERVVGLELGADDYVAKPYFPRELVARLRAILRRTQRSGSTEGPAQTLKSGELVLHPGTRTAEWRDAPLDLTGAEFSILEVLMRNAGQLVSKQDMSKRAFGQPLTAFDRRIDVHISSIRQKLGLRQDGQSWIRTVRGQGYQLVTDR